MTISTNTEVSTNESNGHGVNNDLTKAGANHRPDKSDQSSKTLFDWMSIMGVPVVVVLMGIVVTSAQFHITNRRQDADSADKAIETKQAVLTDYSKTIEELLMKNKEETVKNKGKIVRGLTLIALRRLNPVPPAKPNADSDNSVDANRKEGELKGTLVRYLYELGQLALPLPGEHPKGVLQGADVDHVVLEDAWLWQIDLTGAWLRNGQFTKADMRGAVLSGAVLSGANLTNANLTDAVLLGADLRGANLTNTVLSGADLRSACYVEGSDFFPPGFNPTEAGMVPMAKDKSELNDKANFQTCPPVKI